MTTTFSFPTTIHFGAGAAAGLTDALRAMELRRPTRTRGMRVMR